MTLVIFGYVKHFHVMQLAYRHALTSFDDISDVVVIWDDYIVPPDMDLGAYLGKTLNCRVVTTSSLPFINESVGWLRQQFVKLNMHQILPDREFILLDGDCIVRTHRPMRNHDGVLINYYPPFENFKPYFDTIEKFLGLVRKDRQSFMSPYWLCERDVLIALNNHAPNLITDFQQSWRHSMCWPIPFSECETYGLFASQILGQKFDHQNWDCLEVNADKFVDAYNNTDENLVLIGPDSMPESFWHQYGIEFNKDLIKYSAVAQSVE